MQTIRRILTTGLLATAALQAPASEPRAKADANQPIPVRVAATTRRMLERTLDFVGDIRAQDEATAFSKVTGKVEEKLKEDGARVERDEILAYVDRDEVGFNFERAPVLSPLDGFVGRVYVDLGAQVGPQTPIAIVLNMDQVKVSISVPDRQLPLIATGQPVRVSVDMYPQTFTGHVAKVSPLVDLLTRTAPAEVLIPNPGYLLKPGMFARVQLVLEERQDVRMVAREAVLGKEADAIVYVVKDGKAQRRPVRLGHRVGAQYEVLEGLEDGDRVVVLGQQRLRDGSPVLVDENNGSPSPQGQKP